MKRDHVLEALKIAGVVAVTLYYARRSQQAALAANNPEPFVSEAQKLVNMWLEKSQINDEAKLALNEVTKRAAHGLMLNQIKRAQWEKKLT